MAQDELRDAARVAALEAEVARLQAMLAMYQAPVPPEWENHVRRAWRTVREHDSTIPDEALDRMRDMLLQSTPPA